MTPVDLSPQSKSILVNLNGEIMEAARAKVSVFDRSYLYGDSLYEVVRSYDGRFLKLDEHLDRLGKSAQLTHMTLGQSLEHYEKEILRTFQAWRELPGHRDADAYCRIVVSRGEGKIGFGLGGLTTPTLYTIYMLPLELPTTEARKRGYHFKIAERLRNDPRALDPAMKTGNYLNSLLAYLEAVPAFDDALMLNRDGHVSEGTTFNIFYVKRGIIATPPLDIGILDGVTRRLVIQCARKLGYPVREVRFPKERLYEADEIFMSSSVKEVFPVTRIDNKRVGKGEAGPITIALEKAYAEARKQP
ncbi:MAG: aminotransferase class IV [Oligoflexia bacterium]|nr:aminotransferase class IV [Oligoflexia bacterium]